MERQLLAPFRIEPVDSMPLSLEQAHTFLHHFLINQPPEDNTTRAYLSRLEGGLRRDLEFETSQEGRTEPIPNEGKKSKKSKKRHLEQVDTTLPEGVEATEGRKGQEKAEAQEGQSLY